MSRYNYYNMQEKTNKSPQIWESASLRAVRSILMKAKLLQGEDYKMASIQLAECYEHINAPMGGHQPTQEINYQFQYWSSLAFILLAIQQHQQFIQTCKVLARRFPNKKEVLLYVVSNGVNFRKYGSYEFAFQMFKLAEKVMPIFELASSERLSLQAKIISSQGLIAADRSDYKAAIAKLNEAIQKDPENIEYLFIRPSIYIALAEHEKTQISLQECARRVSSEREKLGLRKHQFLSSALSYLKSSKAKLYQTKDASIVNRQIRVYIEMIESISDMEFQQEQGEQPQKYIVQPNCPSIPDSQTKIFQIIAYYQQIQQKGNQNLNHFYSGFANAFIGAYEEAKMMASGRFMIDTSNLSVSIASKIATFIPFIGDCLSQGIDSIAGFITQKNLERMSKNIVDMYFRKLRFDDFAQEFILQLIKRHEKFLKSLDPEIPVLAEWTSGFGKLLEYLKMKKEELEEKLFGTSENFVNEVEKYGFLVASKLVSTYIASGELVDRSKRPPEMIDKLVMTTVGIVDEDIKLYKQQSFWRDIKKKEIKDKEGRKEQEKKKQEDPKKAGEVKPQKKKSFFARWCAFCS